MRLSRAYTMCLLKRTPTYQVQYEIYVGDVFNRSNLRTSKKIHFQCGSSDEVRRLGLLFKLNIGYCYRSTYGAMHSPPSVHARWQRTDVHAVVLSLRASSFVQAGYRPPTRLNACVVHYTGPTTWSCVCNTDLNYSLKDYSPIIRVYIICMCILYAQESNRRVWTRAHRVWMLWMYVCVM